MNVEKVVSQPGAWKNAKASNKITEVWIASFRDVESLRWWSSNPSSYDKEAFENRSLELVSESGPSDRDLSYVRSSGPLQIWIDISVTLVSHSWAQVILDYEWT